MVMTNAEIIQMLGGVTAIARMLDIKPPSVQGWLETGIPDLRLQQLAGQLEKLSEGRFTRKARWPDKFDFYWPELAQARTESAPPATENVALTKIQALDISSSDQERREWEGRREAVRRDAERRGDVRRLGA